MLEKDRRWKSRVRSRAVAEMVGRRSVAGWRWMPSLRAGGISGALMPGRLSVSLVVVALLFCHGAFGYAHQLPPVDAPTAHAAGGHQPDSDQGTDRLHPGDTYFATLLLLLFGASLLQGGGVPVGVKLPARTPWLGGHKVGGLPPSRGPTLPLLQVFRF